jgi:hypothetical protein
MLGMLRARLENGSGQRRTACLDGLSWLYLSAFQGMAVQARDGATQAELKTVVAAAMAIWPGGG